MVAFGLENRRFPTSDLHPTTWKIAGLSGANAMANPPRAINDPNPRLDVDMERDGRNPPLQPGSAGAPPPKTFGFL